MSTGDRNILGRITKRRKRRQLLLLVGQTLNSDSINGDGVDPREKPLGRLVSGFPYFAINASHKRCLASRSSMIRIRMNCRVSSSTRAYLAA
jgi:hypothetical protein